MQFKRGSRWIACYNEELDLYTASYDADGLKLYEINKEIFDKLEDATPAYDAYTLLREGRRLYMEVIDRCGPPYTIVFDKDYQKLCSWIFTTPVGMVAMLDSEKDNREY